MSVAVKKSLPLPDGGAVLLYDMSNPDKSLPATEIELNVYRVDAKGAKLWQISAPPPVRPRTPFTNIYFVPDGKLRAFRFDCYEHEVDLDTGQAFVVDYLK